MTRAIRLRVTAAGVPPWIIVHRWSGVASPAQEVALLNRLSAEQDLGLHYELIK